jgi:4-aminobutyrate aminotransferase-like enzyme
MIAAEFVVPGTDKAPNPEAARNILNRMLENGLLCYPCGHWAQTIRLIPPINVSPGQMEEGLSIFEKAVIAEG